jgi:hypothetical protein
MLQKRASRTMQVLIRYTTSQARCVCFQELDVTASGSAMVVLKAMALLVRNKLPCAVLNWVLYDVSQDG